jgi:TPR repeat protein
MPAGVEPHRDKALRYLKEACETKQHPAACYYLVRGHVNRINQSINQSINLNQSINRINQLINQPNQSIDQPPGF